MSKRRSNNHNHYNNNNSNNGGDSASEVKELIDRARDLEAMLDTANPGPETQLLVSEIESIKDSLFYTHSSGRQGALRHNGTSYNCTTWVVRPGCDRVVDCSKDTDSFNRCALFTRLQRKRVFDDEPAWIEARTASLGNDSDNDNDDDEEEEENNNSSSAAETGEEIADNPKNPNKKARKSKGKNKGNSNSLRAQFITQQLSGFPKLLQYAKNNESSSSDDLPLSFVLDVLEGTKPSNSSSNNKRRNNKKVKNGPYKLDTRHEVWDAYDLCMIRIILATVHKFGRWNRFKQAMSIPLNVLFHKCADECLLWMGHNFRSLGDFVAQFPQYFDLYTIDPNDIKQQVAISAYDINSDPLQVSGVRFMSELLLPDCTIVYPQDTYRRMYLSKFPALATRIPQHNSFIVITSDTQVAEKWIQDKVLSRANVAVACDSEWDCATIPLRSTSPNHILDILQICTDDGCLILQSLECSVVPPRALVYMFANSAIPKVWFNQGEDVRRLKAWFDMHDMKFVQNGAVDLTVSPLAKRFKNGIGLEKLIALCKSIRMAKDHEHKFSRWSRLVLGEEQVKYGMEDVFAMLMLYRDIQNPATLKELIQRLDTLQCILVDDCTA